MQERIVAILDRSAQVHKQIAATLGDQIAQAATIVIEALQSGGKVALCGNGGSAADAQHIAGELVGHFQIERSPLAALALTTDTSVLTSVSNDFGFDQVFRKQVEALLQPGDVLIALSTSGDSANVLEAVQAARQNNIRTIGMTGAGGGRLAEMVDLCLRVPDEVTARIQEAHITIGHVICALVEEGLAAGAENS